MAISCSFFDHVKYPASEFLNRDKDFINNGVLHLTDFALSSPITPNMTMNAAAGVAWVSGYRIGYDANPVQVLTFAAANATNPRIDLVEIGYTGAGSTGSGVLKVVTGTPAVSPLQPQPDAGFMALFAVAVATNAIALTTANVTDLRVSVSLIGATNTPLASSVPASITPNSTGNTGTGTHAAREDHQHPAPATYPPSAHASTHASGGADALTAGSATDSVIGNRTGDSTLANPASTGTLTQLLGWIMGRIKAITGTTNWYDTPDITLATLNIHKSRHAIGGSDVIAPSDIGAATSAQGAKADGSIQSSLGTASDQVLVSSGVGSWAAKTLAQFKTWLGLGSAAYTDSTAYATSAQGAEADSTATTVTAHLADYATQTHLAHVKGSTSVLVATDGTLSATPTSIGAFGVLPDLASNADFNTITAQGSYLVGVSSSMTNKPPDADYSLLEVYITGGSYIIQRLTPVITNTPYYRAYSGSTWTPWVRALGDNELATVATPNMLLKLNSSSKLPASITGDAATVGGKTIQSGTATTSGSAGTTITVTVTFPVAFSSAPLVLLTPQGSGTIAQPSVNSNSFFDYGVMNASTTEFTIVSNQGAGTGVQYSWIAIGS